MPSPKILVIPGSLRSGSHNVRLAALAVKELTLADAEVTRISLQDFDLPIYDADLEDKIGVPANAFKLKQMMCGHAGIFITCPEYNASVTPLVKNVIDWVSRVREKGETALPAFKNRVFALGNASPRPFGGMRALIAVRQILEVGCGALTIPDMVAVPHAEQAFDDKDELTDPRMANLLRASLVRLVEIARSIGARADAGFAR
ncbi:MAG: NADPH-dependent FMN reductase [Pseudolabrys sp.]